jgi:hypothetical protein
VQRVESIQNRIEYNVKEEEKKIKISFQLAIAEISPAKFVLKDSFYRSMSLLTHKILHGLAS